MLGLMKLCESLPAVTRLTVYRRPKYVTHRASLASLKKLSSESNNDGWEDCWHIKARLCVASDAFFYLVRRMPPSEFNEDLKEPSSGIKERYCVIGVFVIIMGAEHDWRIGFVS